MKLVQDELHDPGLEDHVDGEVDGRLDLGPEQCGSEHDGDAGNRHPVELPMLDHPVRGGERGGSRGGGGGERGGEEGVEREEVLRRRVKDKALTGRCS